MLGTFFALHPIFKRKFSGIARFISPFWEFQKLYDQTKGIHATFEMKLSRFFLLENLPFTLNLNSELNSTNVLSRAEF